MGLARLSVRQACAALEQVVSTRGVDVEMIDDLNFDSRNLLDPFKIGEEFCNGFGLVRAQCRTTMTSGTRGKPSI